MKAAALRGALSDRARTGRLHVVDSIVAGDKPSTKLAMATLRELTPRPRVLIVVDRDDTITSLSLRNVGDVVILTFDQLNTYDVLLSDDIVFTQAAFDAFVAARSAEGAKTIALSKRTRPRSTRGRQAGRQEGSQEGAAPRRLRPRSRLRQRPWSTPRSRTSLLPRRRRPRRRTPPRPTADGSGQRDGDPAVRPRFQGPAQERQRSQGLHDQGQRRLRSLPHRGQPVVRADGRRGLVRLGRVR